MDNRTPPLVVAFLLVIALWSPRPAHAAAISLSGSETLTLSSDQTLTGDIELSGDAVLTVSGAVVQVEPAPGSPRANITLSDAAQLILENASLVPPLTHPDNLYLTAAGTSQIQMTNSTFYNVINLVDSAGITGTNAVVASSAAPFRIAETAGAFGIVQLAGNAAATFTDSTVGSFALFFGPDDDVELSNLKPQTYADFDLQRDASKLSVAYNIRLTRTRVLPVRLKGPFERSWAIFVDPATKIRISDSSLNKLVFQQFTGETLTFSNLKLDTPQSFDFRAVHLSNTAVANEWGFFGQDSNITVVNGKGVWLWPVGAGKWKLKNSQMIEFDPRRFTGTLTFDNAEWANAGEVFEGTAMTIRGTYKATQQLNEHLAVSGSRVTREYPVKVQDASGRFLKRFNVDVYSGTKRTARFSALSGTAHVKLAFNDSNFQRSLTLKVTVNGKTIRKKINLFSATPFVLQLP